MDAVGVDEAVAATCDAFVVGTAATGTEDAVLETDPDPDSVAAVDTDVEAETAGISCAWGASCADAGVVGAVAVAPKVALAGVEFDGVSVAGFAGAFVFGVVDAGAVGIKGGVASMVGVTGGGSGFAGTPATGAAAGAGLASVCCSACGGLIGSGIGGGGATGLAGAGFSGAVSM